MPTPPPITMPSINATYGLLNRPICALSEYSSYQNCRALGPVGARTLLDCHDVAAGAQATFTGAGDHAARISSSSSQSVSASDNLVTMRWFSELMAFGRFQRHQADAVLDSY